MHVVVTGAGNGLGQEYALRFAVGGRRGQLFSTSTNASRAVSRRKPSGRRRPRLRDVTDVTDEDAVGGAIGERSRNSVTSAVLVNNAGLHMGRFNET